MKANRFFLFIALFMGAATVLFGQTPAQNKETTRKILAAVDAGDVNTFASYISPEMDEHMPMPEEMKDMSDYEAAKAMVALYHKSFPDSKTDIKHIVAEGDIVMVYSVWSGTHKGEFMGMAPTNKFVKADQMDVIRFDRAGKAVEHWAVFDSMAMMEQLGMMSK